MTRGFKSIETKHYEERDAFFAGLKHVSRRGFLRLAGLSAATVLARGIVPPQSFQLVEIANADEGAAGKPPFTFAYISDTHLYPRTLNDRFVRAILKAADVCALEPERVARFLVDKGYTPNYDYALQTMQEVPYDKWREYDPEDTVRFYALRLHEAGMIKSSPQKLIAQGTDWRFLNALKKELKR